MGELPPIRREVLVDGDPSRAFEVFTEGIGRWWPLTDFGVHGEGGTVAFRDGAIVETSSTGAESVWGTVIAWQPARLVSFTWHPGGAPERASRVSVTFAQAGGRTLVSLQHHDWEAYADPAASRTEYGQGWPVVLGHFADECVEPATWAALLHRPGPAAPSDGSVFADPRFADHVAFLERMRAAGNLIAAGPLNDADGDGMTVLRLPGEGRFEEIVQLANEDDASVASGFFSVRVRPWRVVLAS